MEKFVDIFGVGEANTQKLFEGGNDLSEIEQGLFIGSVAEAANKDLLKSSNVTHILTIAVALTPPYPDDFVYKVIEVVDRSETNFQFDGIQVTYTLAVLFDGLSFFGISNLQIPSPS